MNIFRLNTKNNKKKIILQNAHFHGQSGGKIYIKKTKIKKRRELEIGYKDMKKYKDTTNCRFSVSINLRLLIS